MRRFKSVAVLFPALVVFGCAPASDKAAPQGQAAAASVRPSTASPGALIITPENSKIEFVGKKAEGQHLGGFKQFSGTIDPVQDDLSASRITVEIDTESLYTDTPKLTTHLKSPDFFEVKTHPKATFVSTSIRPEAAGDATHTITGDLTLHGVKKEISFPAKVQLAADALTLASNFTINRQDFGIKFGPGKVYDDVAIGVAVRAPRK